MFDRRMVVLLLLVGNIVFWAWTSGWLATWGWVPVTDSEPQRLGQQVAPYKLQVQIDKAPDEPAAAAPRGKPP